MLYQLLKMNFGGIEHGMFQSAGLPNKGYFPEQVKCRINEKWKNTVIFVVSVRYFYDVLETLIRITSP
jgi:hypothetical protein